MLNRDLLKMLEDDCERLAKTRLLHHDEAAARDLALKHLQIRAELALDKARREETDESR
jgi:hypothetical protein